MLVPGPSRIKQTLDTNPVHEPSVPNPSSCDLDDKKHTKARKVPAVLRTMRKTIKHSIQSPKSKVCPVVGPITGSSRHIWSRADRDARVRADGRHRDARVRADSRFSG